MSDDAVRASITVTLGAAKPGLFLDPARDFVGELWYAPIGIDDAILSAQPRTFAALDDGGVPAFAAAAHGRQPTSAPPVRRSLSPVRRSFRAPPCSARAPRRAPAPGYVTVAAPAQRRKSAARASHRTGRRRTSRRRCARATSSTISSTSRSVTDRSRSDRVSDSTNAPAPS